MNQLKVERAIILIAGVGKRLNNITEAPKCLLKINGVRLLERYLSALEKVNIRDVVLVIGHKKEMIIEFAQGLNFQGSIKFIENPDFTRGSILSLYKAKDELDGDVLLMDGDVYFEIGVLAKLIHTTKENLVAIDSTSSSSGEEMMVGIKDGGILDMKRSLIGNYDMVGETVGFYKLSKQASEDLKRILEEQVKSGRHDLGYEDVLLLLFQRIRFEPVIVDGLNWVEIDFEEDIYRAENLARGLR